MARLIYLIGPSGAGKDSLIREIKRRTNSRSRWVIAHRYVTRPVGSGGEDYIALTENEFKQRLNAGFFALDWQSHGYHYGIGGEVEDWLARGYNVLVNGSRAYLADARARFPDLLAVKLNVSHEALHRRLLARRRETGIDLSERMRRAAIYRDIRCPGMIEIDNEGPIEEAAARLLSLCQAGAVVD